MPPAVVNPEASLESRPGDELLGQAELERLSLFANLRKKPSFDKFPGAVLLRKYRRGEVIVRQGDAGWTAFYVLTTADLVSLREAQLAKIKTQLETLSPADSQRQDLTALQAAIEPQLAQLQTPAAATAGETQRRPVVTAYLDVELRSARRPGLLNRLRGLWGGNSNGDSQADVQRRPQFIPNDGPVDIRLDTRRAEMHEGELFGEMSCMSRIPRSATVVANEDCYLLEILRNILDQVRKDPSYKEQMDRIYRERALGPQLRKLSIFADLSEAQFAAVRQRVELITLEPGEVVYDEDDPSDAFYVIRSGLVKVVKNLRYLLRADEIAAAARPALMEELRAGEQAGGLSAAVWKQLGEAGQNAVRQLASDQTAIAPLVDALNALIKSHALAESLGDKKAALVAVLDDPAAEIALAELPEKLADWSDLDVRTFNRRALEAVCPRGIPKRSLTADPRTLTYLARGDFFGEAGVIENLPRSATCLAFGHPDIGQSVGGGGGVVPSRVELVRVSRESFLEVCRSSPQLQARFAAQLELYRRRTQERTESRPWDERRPATLNPRFEELGLVQGQKLMLVDLDRCTRCGDCMRACVNTHGDGASRLFLDGPRFGKYLVPNSCRKCLDPVCMIGCPVGSIVRGDNGEIVIKDWCIGCGLCAEQCPYGSIHMNRLTDLNLPVSSGQAHHSDEVETKKVELRAVVCDLCSSLPSQDPACVYHCPHDAAIRIDARYEFPVR
ncbi:MAG TPA: cyclic nucleotide-binding domain-containing protein [Pirellulales bacterium]|nr:cyclic nucleotide-binding domain-containing protein [Pirellulales bacterium]